MSRGLRIRPKHAAPQPPSNNDIMIFAGCVTGWNTWSFYAPTTVNTSQGSNTLNLTCQLILPVAGTLDKMYLIGDNPAGPSDIELVLFINGVSTAVLVDIPAGNTQGNSGSTSTHANAGDLICFVIFEGNGFDNVAFSIRFTPDP
jgi:hypothetical protein